MGVDYLPLPAILPMRGMTWAARELQAKLDLCYTLNLHKSLIIHRWLEAPPLGHMCLVFPLARRLQIYLGQVRTVSAIHMVANCITWDNSLACSCLCGMLTSRVISSGVLHSTTSMEASSLLHSAPYHQNLLRAHS